MSRVLTKIRTALALGAPNIARAAGYRLGVQLGVNPVRRLTGSAAMGPFFTSPVDQPVSALPVDTWQESARLFSHWPISLAGTPPDWLCNPLTGKRMLRPERPWWQIPDFDPEVGDIKLIWELSRMDWVVALAQRARQGDDAALEQLNAWLADWSQHNPPYQGPNWKCGQEASIRVMHLACASVIQGQAAAQALPGLRDLLVLHLQRIAPTVQYAMAQDNNHGTSEAAALFIGGSWLQACGHDPRGKQWATTGRALLENRAARLIGTQGTFSQYSVNYHRVMLDTFCIAEIWRKRLQLPAFSARLQSRALAATQWLHAMTDPGTGDAPNAGANDGARLLQLTNTAYRDHRPSVQTAMVLFAGKRAYAHDGPWNDALAWLAQDLPAASAPAPVSLLADDGGFMMLRHKQAFALLRYPHFRFRPSQADILHVDLWLDGQACLRDGGTYSYNTDPEWLNYFGGVAGHNTVQFDGREQMPRLSRFLLGDWLKTEQLHPITSSPEDVQGGASYRDAAGARHQRTLELSDTLLRVRDEVQGFARSAVLRWRLAPGNWQSLDARAVRDGQMGFINPDNGHRIIVEASTPVVRCELVQGWESLHYLDKTSVPVLQLETNQPGTLITEYHWTT